MFYENELKMVFQKSVILMRKIITPILLMFSVLFILLQFVKRLIAYSFFSLKIDFNIKFFKNFKLAWLPALCKTNNYGKNKCKCKPKQKHCITNTCDEIPEKHCKDFWIFQRLIFSFRVSL